MKAIQKLNDAQIIRVEYFSDDVISEFIASRHSSANTEKTYRNAVAQLMKYFASKNISEPTTADVDNFINNLRGAKKSASTLRLYSTVTKLFFSWLDRRGLYKNNIAADAEPLKLRKATTHAKKSLSDEQAKKLLHAVKGDSLIERRDRAIIALSLQSGVRTVEVERADKKDFYQDGGDWYLDVQGKGRVEKDATVRIAPQVAELILSYLDLRGEVADDAPLFASTSRNVAWTKPTEKRKANSYGNRLSAQSVGKMIKRMMISVGIRSKDKKKDDKRITPHSTRHYAATTAIKAGVDMREVSEMLRHTSLVVTAVYLHDMSVKTRRAELAVANILFA